MIHDLSACLGEIARGASSATQQIERSLDRAAACPQAFLRLDAAGSRATAEAVDARRALGGPLPALGGLAVSIKDLFDVAGQSTSAGSRVLEDAAPAQRDATAVARLRSAGAALIGRTHMTEFAFSGIGLNPHHPVLRNVPMGVIDPQTPRIPGGSSSGAAASVAAGAAWAALGSDTGGSIRIPAALQGLVGFKNTARLTPTQGALPLSTTLDTVCAMTRSVRDAVLMHELLSARPVALSGRPLQAMRFALATTTMQDALDSEVAAAFDRALAVLSAAGAQIVRVPMEALAEMEPLTAHGGFAAIESWALHRARLAVREADYDPRVAMRMRRGAESSAADYLDLQRARAAWMGRMTCALRGFDAVLSPTVPIVAPPIAALEASDSEFFRINALLLRNPSIVNLLDGCAISLPCNEAGRAPIGLTLWAGGHADAALLDAALRVESALAASRLRAA
jgi:amidase/aspartyl-tRNA(Asn)/glutamyl-tRNA(Gln) amidotransferase subunit A